MGTYLLRRALLMLPTLIGATMLVFFVVAAAPGGIQAVAFSSEGMRPEQRRAREEYLSARYGLDKPLFVQYLRWLNKVSPIGFQTWEREDPEVIKASQLETQQRDAIRPSYAGKGLTATQIDQQLRRHVDLKPDAGD